MARYVFALRCQEVGLDSTAKFQYSGAMKWLYSFILVILFSTPTLAVSLEDELAYRVRFSKAEDVALLLKKGANPNAKNEVGLPMVSVAASRKDKDAVPVLRTLLKAGANVNRGGVNNQYPIIIAARENNVDMMRFLVEEAEADYTVRDLNGMLPLEIADYFGNPDTAELIRDLTERQLEEERYQRSDERRNEVMKELAYGYCEHQYMFYYYTSGQGKHSKAFIDQEIAKYREKNMTLLEDLASNFGISYEQGVVLKKEVGDVLKAELDTLISNRERRRRGVGTKKDLDERCDRIAGGWYQAYLEKEAKMDAEKAAEEQKWNELESQWGY